MRIVCLLPAATEIVAALDGTEHLVAISHECDYPPHVRHLPRVTTTPIDVSQPGAVIDAQVRALFDAGRPVIGVDAALLRELAPDLIVTQELCDVCAVADGEVRQLASTLSPMPEMLSMGGRTLEGVFANIQEVARRIDRTRQADELIASLRRRLDRLGTTTAAPRPRVVCVEWLEPLYLAGHWTPDLVAAAGGLDVGAEAGTHSRRVSWADAAALAPDVIVVMLCGFGVERSIAELERLADPAARNFFAQAPTWVLDGNAYTSRPGPRLIDGAERIAAALAGRTMTDLARWSPTPAVSSC